MYLGLTMPNLQKKRPVIFVSKYSTLKSAHFFSEPSIATECLNDSASVFINTWTRHVNVLGNYSYFVLLGRDWCRDQIRSLALGPFFNWSIILLSASGSQTSGWSLKPWSHQANGRVTDKKSCYPFISVLFSFLIRWIRSLSGDVRFVRF